MRLSHSGIMILLVNKTKKWIQMKIMLQEYQLITIVWIQETHNRTAITKDTMMLEILQILKKLRIHLQSLNHLILKKKRTTENFSTMIKSKVKHLPYSHLFWKNLYSPIILIVNQIIKICSRLLSLIIKILFMEQKIIHHENYYWITVY